MKIYSQSDIGLVRTNNQDCCGTKYVSDDYAFAVVCDGMGGVNGGGTASHITVNHVMESMKSFEPNNVSDQEIKDLLLKISQDANDKVFEASVRDESLSGMGTTIVFLIVLSGVVYIVHAGDSRAYIVSKNTIKQITKDHSIVQELVENGEITKEEARSHPRKNLITRALGVQSSIELDYHSCEFNKDDALLICTDGLTNYLKDDELLEIINSVGDERAVNQFISEAKNRGGSDNITAVLIRN